jgi:protein-disulfide isomerase
LSRTNRVSARNAGRSWPLLLWLPLLMIGALLLAGCASQGSTQQEPSQPAEEQTQDPQTTASGGDRSAESFGGQLGPPTLGDPDAPVVMVEYGDFQ